MTENSKKKDIWDAALTEFASVGYDKASTDAICQKAGVSKGLLFHYYGSKKKLYIAIMNDCMDELISRYAGWERFEGNFAEVALKLLKIKCDFFRERPYVYELLLHGMYQSPESLREEMKSKYDEAVKISMDMLMGIIRRMPLRQNVSEEHVALLVGAVISVFQNKYLPQALNTNIFEYDVYNEIREEFTSIMELMMYGFAKRQVGEQS